MSTQDPPTSAAPALSVCEVQAYQRAIPTRMPFRFGAITMTSFAVVYLRVRFELSDGVSIEGVGASVLSPMWFDKDATRSIEARTEDLLHCVHLAVQAYSEAGAKHAYGLHQTLQPLVRGQCRQLGLSALSSSYGVALLDSAIVDGLCRHFSSTFHAGLRADLFGFGRVPWLPAEPRKELNLRHTVGLGDALDERDQGERLNDDLPETLAEVATEYGCSYYKIKIAADIEANIDRLVRIDEVLRRELSGDYCAVLDGNEQFTDLEAFEPFIEALRAEPRLAAFRDHLLWIEQPVERDAALNDSAAKVLRRIAGRVPIILDESDGTDEVVERALALGYAGVSAKNCKGLFRTLHSMRVLAEHHGAGILSAEDLTSPGGLALHQDTCVVSAIGVSHAERNGHHYVRGLDFLSPAEQENALRNYPALYERTASGLVRLAIKDGVIRVPDVISQGYGGSAQVDLSALETLTLPKRDGGS